MKNNVDSSLVDVADSLPEVDSLMAADSALIPQMPTAEQLGISVVAGSVAPVAVGDTFDFSVTVSWNVQGSAVLVVPVSSANSKGITQLGVSQESARALKDGREVASQTFTFKLVASDTGMLHIPGIRFEIPTPAGAIPLKAEPVDFRSEVPFNPLPVISGVMVGLVVVVAALWRMRQKAKAKLICDAKKEGSRQLRENMKVLKQRVAAADSRQWLLELESVCKGFAADKFNMDVAQVNLEVLAREGLLEGWEELVEVFAQARYGGGKRDAFENKETWKQAMKLMGVEEEL
ncbi:MAG: hypothetical protein HUK21_01645 [Fibrobacteraceae bacterium]|nr:hypothetical protein [Fibrobacteraceae bacterium]